MSIIRVFPHRTSYTPSDPYAFVGDPPLWRPQAEEVHVSCLFTWDLTESLRLKEAWGQYYPVVRIGGPAIYGNETGEFTPGQYVRTGITFTSRGCNHNCPWCLVPEREGKLRLLEIKPGHIINDNNLLQTGRGHMGKVFAMLRGQRQAARFSGGLEAALVDDWVAEELRGLRIAEVWLACDTDGALKTLAKAVSKLSFLPRQKLRCYVLLAFGGETIEQARARLEAVWDIGCLPFAQPYQPPDRYIRYSAEWKATARTWSRPAAMKALHGGI